MAKSTIIMLLLTVSLVTALISFVSADTTKLICLDDGETIEFSKCNSNIPDRTCDSTWGCQFCVTEKSSGVYCPQSINACNSQSLTCSQQSNTGSIDNIPVTQNDEEEEDNSDTDTNNNQNTETNSDNNQQNTQTNSNTNSNTETNTNTQDTQQQTNSQGNILTNLINTFKNNGNKNSDNNVSVKGTLSAKTSEDKNNQAITGNAIDNSSNNKTALNISPIFFLLAIGPVIEFIILSFLLGYVIGKRKISSNNVKGNKNSKNKNQLKEVKESVN